MRLQSSTTSTRDLLGQFMTAPSVALKMAETIAVPGPWRILDPACGDGNLLVAAVTEARARGIEIESIVGYDVDRELLEVATHRLASVTDRESVHLRRADFMDAQEPDLGAANVVIANPPYGRNREYAFFDRCARVNRHAQLIFLVPLAFLDRAAGVEAVAIPGRPLGVTTGHAIASLNPGQAYSFRATREAHNLSGEFQVLTGAKLYERGAGQPPQSDDIIARRAFSSDVRIAGWIPCARTGDVTPDGVALNRLWVDYGPHLAQPKERARFEGPRLFVRRVPIWKGRQLGAAYIDQPAIAAGDLLVVTHANDDSKRLHHLKDFINSAQAAELMHGRRPSIALRDSFPKFSAKDLSWLISTLEGRTNG